MRRNRDLPGIAETLRGFACDAGELLLDMRGGPLDVRKKAPADLVTAADEESHRVLSGKLAAAFPSIPLVMEEQDNDAVLPETYIAVDELDGTNIFVHGCPEWGLSLAFVDRGEPVAGVLHQPALGSTLTAWRGGGTWLDGRRVVLDQGQRLSDGIALFELNAHLRTNEFAWMAEIVAASLANRALATAVGSAVALLRGHAALYVNCRGGKVWDFAAAALAVTEAGGCVVQPDGTGMKWDRLHTGVLMAENREIMEFATALEATPDDLLDEPADPDEKAVREAFFRKFGKLDPDDKKRVEDMIEAWDKKR